MPASGGLLRIGYRSLGSDFGHFRGENAESLRRHAEIFPFSGDRDRRPVSIHTAWRGSPIRPSNGDAQFLKNKPARDESPKATGSSFFGPLLRRAFRSSATVIGVLHHPVIRTARRDLLFRPLRGPFHPTAFDPVMRLTVKATPLHRRGTKQIASFFLILTIATRWARRGAGCRRSCCRISHCS
jgi:hypothetical protein